MQWLIDSAAVAGMFILRLGVPLAITFGVAYLLRRLDKKWEAEARQQASGAQEAIAANCAYADRTDMPCWVARRQQEGQLAAECYSCARFALRKVA